MKILIILLWLNGGGAERIAVQLAHDWVARGHDVTLATYSTDHQWPPFYEVRSSVRRLELNIHRNSDSPIKGLMNNVRRISCLRRLVRDESPDVVVSHLPRECTAVALAMARLNIPHIAFPHSDPARKDSSRMWDLAYRLLLAWHSKIVVQAHGSVERLPKKARNKAVVIANPVRTPPVSVSRSKPENSGKRILIVGSLREIKNQQNLLRAFSRLARDYPDWQLELAGDGPLRGYLEKLAQDLEIAERTVFHGQVPNVYPLLAGADIYVSCSNSEGFSLALCEALSVGLPVVATACSDAQREIVQDGQNGVLVPVNDVEALAEALRSLIESPERRRVLGEEGRSIIDRFGEEGVFSAWAELLETTVGHR